MRFGNIIRFRDDLFFEGAVQIDWFYEPKKASTVAKSFVFHGKNYFGIPESGQARSVADTASFVQSIAGKLEDEQRSNPFTLAIAGYGTGKSHLALSLAQLLSGPDYMPDTYRKIIANIRRVDEDAANSVVVNTKSTNLVLTINGPRF